MNIAATVYVALTELPVAAEALSIRRFVQLQRSGRDTWVVAITGEGQRLGAPTLTQRAVAKAACTAHITNAQPCIGPA